MANQSIPQTDLNGQAVNTISQTITYVPLNDGSLFRVPEGADADFVRQVQNRILANKAAGSKRTSRRSCRCNSKHTNYAAQAVARAAATVELVDRVNGRETLAVNGLVVDRSEFLDNYQELNECIVELRW